MNRAILVYVCVFAAFAAGIWATFEIGSRTLTAPADFTGTWLLQTDRSHFFSVEQSGRFVHVSSDAGKTLDLVMDDAVDYRGNPPIVMRGKGAFVTTAWTGDTVDWQFNTNVRDLIPSGTYIRKDAANYFVPATDPTDAK